MPVVILYSVFSFVINSSPRILINCYAPNYEAQKIKLFEDFP